MLYADQDIVCGIFDSTVALKSSVKTDLRPVDCYELEIFSEAIGTSYVNGVAYPVERGAFICAKPGQHRFSILPIKCYFIRFFALESAEAKILADFPTRSVLPANSVDDICGLFLKLGSYYIDSMEQSQKTLMINKLFYEILFNCRKLLFPTVLSVDKSVVGNVTVLKAKEFIDKNFGTECSLSAIAEQVHVSPNYLHFLFKNQSGQSPLDYVVEKRIENAKRQLIGTDHSLLDIALDSGFSSQSYFGKVFREKTGMSPQKYRKRFLLEY